MKRFLLLALLSGTVALASCEKNPVETSQSSNAEVKVSLLFEHDGCKIYRFYDGMKKVYYSKCLQPSQVSWNDTVSTGKTILVVPQQTTTTLVTE